MSSLTLESVMAELATLRREMQSQIADLTAQVAALKTMAHQPDAAEVSPEELVMIAAAVTSFLGVGVRIRSARRVVESEAEHASAWALQSRVFVQAAAHAARRVTPR